MKITFRAFNSDAGLNGIIPSPASKALPKWFKSISQFIGNNKSFDLDSSNNPNLTVKACSPFLDSLIAGYVIYLENDILVKKIDGEISVQWTRGGNNLVSSHSVEQIDSKQIPSGFYKIPLKFENSWSIITPKGYSALIVHPLNRTDLPFYTLSGFVDTDDYHLPVNFPFVMRDDFEGIIEAGTPIAQIIPVKRELWAHKIEEFDANFSQKNWAKLKSKVFKSYKTQFWKRKDYK